VEGEEEEEGLEEEEEGGRERGWGRADNKVRKQFWKEPLQ
jgi:hypothetical protein